MEQPDDALDDLQLFLGDLKPFVESRDELSTDVFAW